MADKIKGSRNFDNSLSRIELDLLASLLEPEDNTYPWNPWEEDTTAYFDDLEEQFQQLPMQDLLDEELQARSACFHNQLDALWSKVETSAQYNCNTNTTVAVKLQKSLQKQFRNTIPLDWIDLIAHKAAEIFLIRNSQ